LAPALRCASCRLLLGPAGITLSDKQVQRGTQLAAERGLGNVKFMVRARSAAQHVAAGL
jgi:hypothetical protein